MMDARLAQLRQDTPKEIAARAVSVGTGTETRPGNGRFRHPIMLCGITVATAISDDYDYSKVYAAEQNLREAVARLLEDPTRKVW